MTIRRIFLPFCDAAGFAPIANAAFTLGRLFHAQVHGLFAQHLEGPAFIPQEGMNVQRVMHAIEKASRERAEQLRQTQETFTACAKGYPEVEAQFTAMDGAKADIVGSVARLADITIVGSGPRSAPMAGALSGTARSLAVAGRSSLTPPAGLNENAFGRVVIAWKITIEAARAIAAAQPFFSLAKAVHLVTIGESGDTKGVPARCRAVSAASFRGDGQCGNPAIGKECRRDAAVALRSAGRCIARDGRL